MCKCNQLFRLEQLKWQLAHAEKMFDSYVNLMNIGGEGSKKGTAAARRYQSYCDQRNNEVRKMGHIKHEIQALLEVEPYVL